MAKWIRVGDKLPEEDGRYLVYAPTYEGGSSRGLDCVDGVMFSRYRAKTGKWSIEHGYYKRMDCVKYWMPLPEPPKECTIDV